MTSHTVTPSRTPHRCSCGREFAKAFGLHVHQRTCVHWNEPHPREDAPAAPVSPVTHRAANTKSDCGCLWYQGRHIENDERVATCPTHAIMFPTLPQAKHLAGEVLQLAPGCQMVEQDFCYRCGSEHYRGGRRMARDEWQDADEPFTSRTHTQQEPAGRQKAIVRATGALLDELSPQTPGRYVSMPERTTAELEVIMAAAEYLTTWVGPILERRAQAQMDLLDELEG